jgi:hypothetical protein
MRIARWAAIDEVSDPSKVRVEEFRIHKRGRPMRALYNK